MKALWRCLTVRPAKAPFQTAGKLLIDGVGAPFPDASNQRLGARICDRREQKPNAACMRH